MTAKLTEAQARALRDLRKFQGRDYSECSNADWESLVSAEFKPELVAWNDTEARSEITPAGHAAIAAYDAAKQGGNAK